MRSKPDIGYSNYSQTPIIEKLKFADRLPDGGMQDGNEDS